MSKRLIIVGGLGTEQADLDQATLACQHSIYRTRYAKRLGFEETFADQGEIHGQALAEADCLISHSTGVVAVAAALGFNAATGELENLPKRLLIVAPPTPIQVPALIRRATKVLEEDHQRPSQDIARALIDKYMIRNNSAYQGQLNAIANFNVFDFARSVYTPGRRQVGLIFPDKDEFFRPRGNDLKQTRRAGVLVDKVPNGHHSDFLIDPRRGLGKIALASQLD